MEGNLTENPGIGMEWRDNRKISMTWKGSIEKIIATVKMKECNPKTKECNPNKTPAPTTVSGSNVKGKPQNHWDHTSIVGMSLHMSSNTRPDMTFAASQAA